MFHTNFDRNNNFLKANLIWQLKAEMRPIGPFMVLTRNGCGASLDVGQRLDLKLARNFLCRRRKWFELVSVEAEAVQTLDLLLLGGVKLQPKSSQDIKTRSKSICSPVPVEI